MSARLSSQRRRPRGTPARLAAAASVLILTTATLATQAGLAPHAGATTGLPDAATAAAINAAHANDPSPAGQDDTAFAQAKSTGKNVQIDRLTTEFTETYATPAGHYQQTAHPDQQRLKAGDQWKSLDATLAPQQGGGYAPGATPSGVVLSGGGSGPLATMTSPDGKKLALTAPFNLPAPQVSGDNLLYPSVLPDTDLKVTVGKSGSVSTVLVLKTKAAAANPALKKLHFATTADGVTVQTGADQNLTAQGSDGKPRWTAPAPTMWDSSNTTLQPVQAKAAVMSSTVTDQSDPTAKPPISATSSADGPGSAAKVVTMPVDATSDGLDLTPDQTLLTTGVAPFYVDPAWIPWSTSSNGNTFVQSNYPTATHYNVNTERLGVGKCGTYSAGDSCVPSGLYRAFYQFDTSPLRGAIINSAKLDVWEYSSADWSCTNSYPVDVYWEDGPIGPGTDWGHQPNPQGGKLDSSNVAGSGSSGCYNDIDVQFSNMGATLSNAITGNNIVTIGLRGDENNQNAFKRFEYNASLSVTYDRVPSVPTDPQVNPAPYMVSTGQTNQNCNGGWQNWSWLGAGTDAAGAVTISTVVSSPVQDQLRSNLGIWDYTSGGAGLPAGTNTESPWTTNGSRATYTLPGGFIKNGHVYGYHLQATDELSGSSWSGWGPVCTFGVDQTPPVVSLPSRVNDLAHQFPPSGNGQTTQLFAGQSGYLPITVTDPVPTGGTDVSGLACLRWSADPQFNGASFQCGSNMPNGQVPVTPGHWGTNIEYIQAKDNAGNVSPVLQYPYYAPWNPNGPPPVFGDLTGDGAPDILTTDAGGNLRTYSVPGNASASGPAVALSALKSDSPHYYDPANPGNDPWSNYQITHRGSLSGGNNVDDVIVHKPGDATLYYYPNNSTASGIPGRLGQKFTLKKPDCFISANQNCSSYQTDWSGTVQIAAIGDPKNSKLSPVDYKKAGLIAEELGRDGNTGLWFYPTPTTGTFDKPVQLATTGWAGMDLITPGDWTGGGTPGLWARNRSTGVITAYALTPGTDTSSKTNLGYDTLTAISAPITIGMVPVSDVPILQSDGNLTGQGFPSLWGVTADKPGDKSRITTWYGAPAMTNGVATGYNWTGGDWTIGNTTTVPDEWLGTVTQEAVGVSGEDRAGINPLTGTGSVSYSPEHPGGLAAPLKGSVTVNNTGILATPYLPNSDVTTLSNDQIASGKSIASKTATLTMQSDGNLILSPLNSTRVLWSSGTYNHPGAIAKMQVDGNFVIYDGQNAIWSTNTFGTNLQLKLQSDLNLVIYQGTNVVWTTNTYNTAYSSVRVAAGRSDIANSLAAPGVDTSGSYSVAAWVKIKGDTGHDQTPVCQQGNSVPSMNIVYRESDHGWGVYAPNQDDPNASWAYAGAPAGTAFVDGWTHVAATYSADSKMLSFYLNGYFAGSTPANSWGESRPMMIGGCYFNNNYGAIVYQLNGLVSDVRTYPYALTTQQVAALYSLPKQTMTSGLSSSKCIDDDQGSRNNDNKIQIWDCNSSDPQKFSLPGDGTIHIYGKCLDSGAGTAGTPLKLWDCNGSGPQKFNPDPSNNNRLVSQTHNECVDLPQSNIANGTQLQLWDCNSSNAQSWPIN
ncbi:ricin-type beta-trefoil lectin domain protein [Kitasatospora azatica]|uniref:ricin-type beta-trefoil lectin domain protein n=1 Tax=Kitasatospora azatica TaxID=58347 RepID=UPI0005698EC1|nr:ricin-type beta-trefoil lectin domain protein [Kitasatospora azatica]